MSNVDELVEEADKALSLNDKAQKLRALADQFRHRATMADLRADHLEDKAAELLKQLWKTK